MHHVQNARSGKNSTTSTIRPRSGVQNKNSTSRLRPSVSSHSLPTTGGLPIPKHTAGQTKPWYLVPGQREKTDRLLSARRERDAQRQATYEVADRYFKRTGAQNLFFHKWESDKTMLKYPQRDKSRSMVSLSDPKLYDDQNREPDRPSEDRSSSRGERRHFAQSNEDSFSRSKYLFKSSSNLNTATHQHSFNYDENCDANNDLKGQPTIPLFESSPLTYKSFSPERRITAKSTKSKSKLYNDQGSKLNAEENEMAILDRLGSLMDRLLELRSATKALKSASRLLITFQERIVSTQSELVERQDSDWTIREKKISYMHFARDKLRQKAFITCDQLLCGRAVVSFLDNVVLDGLLNWPTQSENAHPILRRDEYEQFGEVNSSAIKLLDTYLHINQQRNFRYQLLFHEEAENCWDEMQEEWAHETELWQSMLHQLFDTYLTLVAGKLSDNVAAQEDNIAQREKIVAEMAVLGTQTKMLSSAAKPNMSEAGKLMSRLAI